MCSWYFSFRGRGGCRCPDLGGGQMFGHGKACSEAAVRNWRSAFGSHDRTFAPSRTPASPNTAIADIYPRGKGVSMIIVLKSLKICKSRVWGGPSSLLWTRHCPRLGLVPGAVVQGNYRRFFSVVLTSPASAAELMRVGQRTTRIMMVIDNGVHGDRCEISAAPDVASSTHTHSGGGHQSAQ